MLQPWLCVSKMTRLDKMLKALFGRVGFDQLSFLQWGGDCMWPTLRYCAEINYVQIPLPDLTIFYLLSQNAAVCGVCGLQLLS